VALIWGALSCIPTTDGDIEELGYGEWAGVALAMAFRHIMWKYAFMNMI